MTKQGSGHSVTIDASGRYELKRHPFDGPRKVVMQNYYHYQYLKHDGNVKKMAAEMECTERAVRYNYHRFGFPVDGE